MIYLIRHGQTNGNRDRIVQTPDTPLSELGQQQAQQLAKALEQIDISKIVCSDYLRTQQTAEPLKKLKATSVSLSPLLRERNFGDLRGRSYDQIEGDFFAPDYIVQNGESHAQFKQRMALAWDFILDVYQSTPASLVVMTHGLVLREFIQEHLIVGEDILPLSDFQNTCITQVDGADKKTVLRLCDAQHLHQTYTLSAIV